MWTFSSCSELWLLFGVVLRFLTAVVCVLEEHRLEGTWAQWLPGLVAMQHVAPGLGTEPMSPALAARFLITGPPGESSFHYYYLIIIYLWGFLPPNPAILNSAGLEQTNVCFRAMLRNGWFVLWLAHTQKTPSPLKGLLEGFQQSIFKGQGEGGDHKVCDQFTHISLTG